MKINKAGLEIIKKYEGCRLVAYRCPAGVLTIGYGHTGDVKPGDKITQEQANSLLLKDIRKFEKYVNTVNKEGVYNFNRNEFSALVSFTFNLGWTNLLQLTQDYQRDKKMIGEKMTLYVKANGKTLKGLVDRRKAEQDLYFQEVKNGKGKKI